MTSGWKWRRSGYIEAGVPAKSQGARVRNVSSWAWIPRPGSRGIRIRSAARRQSATSRSWRPIRPASRSNSVGVLVRAGHLVDAEISILGRDVVAEVRPQPGSLEDDLGAAL